MSKIYLSLFVLVVAFGFITIFEKNNDLKNTANNEAAAIQYNGGSGEITDIKNSTIVTNDTVSTKLGVIAPLPSASTKTVNTIVNTTVNTTNPIQPSNISVGVVSGGSGVPSCDCICPYAAKIVILGIGSKANSPEAKWFQENVPGSTIYPLSGGLSARINQIRNQIKQIQGSLCPKQKILIIGYSLGAAIAKNLKNEFPCIDVIAIDPPDTNWCRFFMARWASPALRQICRSNSATADTTVNWTSGNSGDTPNHYPWDNPASNVQKLKDLKSTLDNAKCEPESI